MRRPRAKLRHSVIELAAMACLVCATTIDGQARQRYSAVPLLQISELQKQIRAGGAAHASAQQLATLWIDLGGAYKEVVDLESAENAFAHAIRLLRGADAQVLYANALDGIATVYFATGRADKAERSLRRAVEHEHAAGELNAETITRRDLAAALIKEGKYAEAVKQATEVISLLQAQPDPNVGETIVVYLMRSRATCGMQRCADALLDVDRAEALAVNSIGTDPINIITIPALRGMEQFRSGAVEQGDRTIQQALRQVDSQADLPAPFQMHLREALLEEYSQLLGSAHRGREKKKIDEEIARIKAQQPGCDRCTVSAASFGLFP